jgi:hypothetical protein
MTFATIDKRETTTVEMGNFKTIVAAIFERINEYRAERKELRDLDSYHTESTARLEQAQRDLNQFWLR